MARSVVTLTLPADLVERLKTEAKAVDRNLSNYISWLLKSILKEKPDEKQEG